MTHEELLDKIENIEYWQEQYAGKTFMKALRAVVEMHRPALDSEMNEFSDNETPGCAGCGFDFNYGTWETNYPCRTIQAIDKELM